MTRFSLSLLLLLLLPLGALAARGPGFGLDAFNRTVPASSEGNAVFSPLAFELDAAILAEAAPADARERYAKALSVMTDLEGVYRPLAARWSAEGGDGGFDVKSARVLLVPRPGGVEPSLRRRLQAYGAETCPSARPDGAAAWCEARLEYALEGVRFASAGESSEDGVALHDLSAMSFRWGDVASEGGDVIVAERYEALRLPMAGGCRFVAVKPRGGATLAETRRLFTSATLRTLLDSFASVTDPAVTHGPIGVRLPSMDLTDVRDAKGAFGYFGLPLAPMPGFGEGAKVGTVRQTVRLRLPALDVRAATARRFDFDRPFIFMVHHPESGTVPVVGQVTGR